MNCPSCGNPTRSGASFCGECGHKLVPTVAAVAPLDALPVAAPLLRPPPPPTEADIAIAALPTVIAAEPFAILRVAPLLVPPPPAAPEEVEVVPFRTIDQVTAPEHAVSSITITSPPPGIGEPPGIAAPPGSGAPTTRPEPALIVPVPASDAAMPIAESLDETRASVRRRTGAHWRLVLSDGRHIEVASSLLVGRDPASNAKWPSAALLAIDDDAHSVSKTHAAFEVNGGDLWVTDLDSTNGIIITQSDGVELDIDPNVRAQLLPGADVELGDYIIQIEKD